MARGGRTTCTTCGKRLGVNNTSGLCVSHFNARLNSDPEAQAKRLAGVRRDASARRDEKRRVLLANAAKAMERPERRAALRERMKWVQPLSQTAEARARVDHASNGRKRTNTVLSWCPRAYRAQYRKFVRARVGSAADCRRIILDQIRKDMGGVDRLAQTIRLQFVEFANDNGITVEQAQRRLVG